MQLLVVVDVVVAVAMVLPVVLVVVLAVLPLVEVVVVAVVLLIVVASDVNVAEVRIFVVAVKRFAKL